MLYLTVASVGGRAASFTVTSPAYTLNPTRTPSLTLTLFPSLTLTLTLIPSRGLTRFPSLTPPSPSPQPSHP